MGELSHPPALLPDARLHRGQTIMDRFEIRFFRVRQRQASALQQVFEDGIGEYITRYQSFLRLSR